MKSAVQAIVTLIVAIALISPAAGGRDVRRINVERAVDGRFTDGVRPRRKVEGAGRGQPDPALRPDRVVKALRSDRLGAGAPGGLGWRHRGLVEPAPQYLLGANGLARGRLWAA